jgi:hypothetical protein
MKRNSRSQCGPPARVPPRRRNDARAGGNTATSPTPAIVRSDARHVGSGPSKCAMGNSAASQLRSVLEIAVLVLTARSPSIGMLCRCCGIHPGSRFPNCSSLKINFSPEFQPQITEQIGPAYLPPLTHDNIQKYLNYADDGLHPPFRERRNPNEIRQRHCPGVYSAVRVS